MSVRRLKGVLTLQAAQAELKTQLQATIGMAIELRWKKLAAQMVAQEELAQLQVRLSIHQCT